MASDDPFISTLDLSNYLGRDVTADDGALIAIDAACNIIRELAGQTFNSVVGDTVALDGTGTDVLLLPEGPVTGAGTVTEGGQSLTQDTDYVIADDLRLVRTAGANYSTYWDGSPGPALLGGGWSSTPIAGFNPRWPQGRQNVVVTYDHGYAGTVPSDVRMVALQVSSRIALQGIVTAETLASQVLTYASPALDLTAGEKLILQRHPPVLMPVTTFLDGRSYTELKGAAWLTMREIGHTVKGTVVSDAGGGGTTIWLAGTIDIPCRIDLAGGAEALAEERIANVQTYVIMVPGDVDIEPADRFAIDGRGTFLITAHHATAPANAAMVYRRAGGEVRAFEAVDLN